MKSILLINGSASSNSSNQRLLEEIARITKDEFVSVIFDELKSLPHFNPELSVANTPDEILAFRSKIEQSDGIIICTPEYVFSVPSGLKNAIEWCVSTTIFTNKPLGIITASASGEKGHEELRLIMKTLMAKFTDETTLLINGIKGKINQKGEIIHNQTKEDLSKFIEKFEELLFNQQ